MPRHPRQTQDPIVAAAMPDAAINAVADAIAARRAMEQHAAIADALRSAVHDRDTHAATAKRLAGELADALAELKQARATIESQRRIINPEPEAEAPETVVYCGKCRTSLGYRSRGDVPAACHICGTQAD